MSAECGNGHLNGGVAATQDRTAAHGGTLDVSQQNPFQSYLYIDKIRHGTVSRDPSNP